MRNHSAKACRWGGGPPRLREDFDHVKRARGTSAIEHQCLSHADFDLAVIGLFFDARVRDELAHRLPHVNAEQLANDAELLVAVRWLCDLDVGAAEGDEPSFQATCVAGLRAHLDSLY